MEELKVNIDALWGAVTYLGETKAGAQPTRQVLGINEWDVNRLKKVEEMDSRQLWWTY